MFNIVAFLSGLIFGIGLILSRMADPAKVLNFLDITGNWDPSLAFVMIGAIAVGLVGFYLARKRPASLLDTPIQLPTATRIDKRLVLGSSLFGTGWGLAGICPGPAIVHPLGRHGPGADLRHFHALWHDAVSVDVSMHKTHPEALG